MCPQRFTCRLRPLRRSRNLLSRSPLGAMIGELGNTSSAAWKHEATSAAGGILRTEVCRILLVQTWNGPKAVTCFGAAFCSTFLKSGSCGHLILLCPGSVQSDSRAACCRFDCPLASDVGMVILRIRAGRQAGPQGFQSLRLINGTKYFWSRTRSLRSESAKNRSLFHLFNLSMDPCLYDHSVPFMRARGHDSIPAPRGTKGQGPKFRGPLFEAYIPALVLL